MNPPPSAELVLVVDDDPDQVYIAARRLRSLGFSVLTATDGLDALLVLSENPGCRKIITDFSMPRLGADAWIRVLERFCSDCQVVVISTIPHDPGPFLSIPKPADFTNIASYFRSER